MCSTYSYILNIMLFYFGFNICYYFIIVFNNYIFMIILIIGLIIIILYKMYILIKFNLTIVNI